MNHIYPSRIVNLISSCVLVLFLMAWAREISGFVANYHNLSPIDKYSTIAICAYGLFTISSSLAVFKRKKWAWIGITSYLLYSLGAFVYEAYKYGLVEHIWIIVVPTFILFTSAIIFLFTKPVYKLFELNLKYILASVALPILIYQTQSINPVSDNEKVNIYYLEIKDGKYFINDTLFSGVTYSNHKNGNIKFIGNVENGLEEGEWQYFDSKGTLEATNNLHAGFREGKEISYFPSGEISEETNYIKGKPSGKYKYWFSPNKLKVSGNYFDGLKHGEWREYEMNSDIVKVMTYSNDSLLNVEYIE